MALSDRGFDRRQKAKAANDTPAEGRDGEEERRKDDADNPQAEAHQAFPDMLAALTDVAAD